MTIEGIPDGWELVKVGKPLVGEYYIDVTGSIYKALDTTPTVLHWYMPIIRKIEKPKRYRPFANAAEFEPHRDRWVRYRGDDHGGSRVAFYDNTQACIGDDVDYWNSHFKDYTFDDGSPFGIEVTDLFSESERYTTQICNLIWNRDSDAFAAIKEVTE